ncbi:major facilitator superfamily domain-containing protein [Lipomyces arxii]|uniref:major facilitator superfamily domain-containing protein n=1 Tax=Lipomyces arxii TaxID=56418 RepID=UPI0034CD2D62
MEKDDIMSIHAQDIEYSAQGSEDIEKDSKLENFEIDDKEPVLGPNELYPPDRGWRRLIDYSPSTIAWISSIEMFIIVFLGIIVGPVYDIVGPKPLVYPGTILMAVGMMMTSLCTEFYQFILAQAICTGIGSALLLNPCFSAVSAWFMHSRATALGITTAGASTGGVIIPIVFRKIEVQAGFAWSMRVVAFLSLALGLTSCACISSRIKPPGRRTIPFKRTYVYPFKNIPFSLASLAVFILFFAAYVPNNYIPSFAVYNGFSPSMGAYLSSIQNAGSTLGRILPGIAADRVGRFNMYIGSSIITTAVLLAFWLTSTGHVPIIIFSGLYGFVAGPVMSVWQSMIAEVSPPEEMGARLGMVNAISAFSCLCGIPIAGAILDGNGGKYTGMAIYTAVLMLTSGAIATLARLYYTNGVVFVRK